MDYIRNIAYQILIDTGANNLPVTIDDDTLRRMGIMVNTIENCAEMLHAMGIDSQERGFTVLFDGKPCVLYSQRLSYSQRNHVIAHELGHIVLGHVTTRNIVGYSDDLDENRDQEIEAMRFANALLAPLPILQLIKPHSAGDIESVTGLPLERAKAVYSDYVSIGAGHSDTDIQLQTAFTLFVSRHRRYLCTPKSRKITAIIIAVVIAAVLIIVCFLHANDNKTYYITDTGTKYHAASCRYVSGRDATAINSDDAKRLKYTPCSECIK